MTTQRHASSVAAMSALALLLVACAGAPDPNPPLSLDGTRWVLEAGTVDGHPLPLVAGHRITLAFEGTRISGTSACNHYGGQATVSGATISVGAIEMTAMGCEPAVMTSEAEFLDALRRVSGIATADGRLILFHGGEIRLEFAVLPAAQLDGITDRTWVLELLVDAADARAPRDDAATLELHADGTLRGSTGSRTLTGTYILRGDEILATRLRADGPDPPAALVRQDAHIVGVTGDGFRARLEDSKLILTSAGNLQLVYGQAAD